MRPSVPGSSSSNCICGGTFSESSGSTYTQPPLPCTHVSLMIKLNPQMSCSDRSAVINRLFKGCIELSGGGLPSLHTQQQSGQPRWRQALPVSGHGDGTNTPSQSWDPHPARQSMAHLNSWMAYGLKYRSCLFLELSI